MIKKPAILGLLASVIVLSVYLLVVILSSPQFTPIIAVTLALTFNGLIMAAIATGVGIQVFLQIYNRRLMCPIKGAGATGATSSTFTTFSSFFVLTNVGCCGLFPFYISLLFGTGIAGALVQYSQTLTTAGLGVMSLTIILMIRGIRKTQASNQILKESD